MARPVRSPSA